MTQIKQDKRTLNHKRQIHASSKPMSISQQKRKIVRHGPGTLTISLPPEWIKRHGLKAGDELHLEPKERSILLNLSSGPAFTKTNIALESIKDQFAARLLTTVYKKGYDSITISFDSTDSLRAIRKELNDNIIGWSIFDETEKSCTVRAIAQESKDEFDTMFRKAFQTCCHIAKKMPELIASPTQQNIEEIQMVERNNNQAVNFCHRLIIKYQLRPLEAPFLYVTLWQIEKIADDYKNAIKYLPLESAAHVKQFLTLFEDTSRLLDIYQQGWYGNARLDTIQQKSQILLEQIKEVKPRVQCVPLQIALASIVQRIKESSPQIIAVNSKSILEQ